MPAAVHESRPTIRGKKKPPSPRRSVAEFTVERDNGKEWKDKGAAQYSRQKSLSRLSAASWDYLSQRCDVCVSASLPRSAQSARSRSHPFIFTHSPFPWALSCRPHVPATFYLVTRRNIHAREIYVCIRDPLTLLYKDIRGCRKASCMLYRVT